MARRCRSCKEEKSSSEFYKNLRIKDGLDTKCKACQRQTNQDQKEYKRFWLSFKCNQIFKG